MGVAPRAGAWIETPGQALERLDAGVAPRAGAWIETRGVRGRMDGVVAPRAGAWIETSVVWSVPASG